MHHEVANGDILFRGGNMQVDSNVVSLVRAQELNCNYQLGGDDIRCTCQGCQGLNKKERNIITIAYLTASSFSGKVDFG